MQAFRHDLFEPSADQIHLPSVPEDVRSFVEKIWFSFVNKVVSLTFSDDSHAFEHAVFEAITGRHIKMVVSSSHFLMRELIGPSAPNSVRRYVAKANPMPIDDERNISAALLRQTMVADPAERPLVIEVDLKNDRRLHPEQQNLLTRPMNHGVAVPVFVKGIPLGVLWGIRATRLSTLERRQVFWQMRTLAEGIDTIVSQEIDGDRDDYHARRSIEKIQSDSKITQICFNSQGPGLPPVKSLFARCLLSGKDYRLDASFIVPGEDGFAISIKRYLPKDDNGTGKNILMVPGFFCNRSVMDRLARNMVLQHGFKVFSLDVRGRSKLTLPGHQRKRWDWTIDDYICKDFPAALRWIQTHYPGERTVVVGHSMGGMIPEFYAGAFEAIKRVYGGDHLPHPTSSIAGIVTLASPSYIDLGLQFPGFAALERGASLLVRGLTGKALRNLVLPNAPTAVRSIDLNRFFNLLATVGASRKITFNIGRSVPTIKDFVGYDGISPPEWYFLMEDVFCRESLKVVYQFLHSQIANKRFLSFNRRIDYTDKLRNVRLPVFGFVGSLDTIAPPTSVIHGLDLIPARNKEVATVEQGHLGIIMHPRTVRTIGAQASEWIDRL